MLLLLIIIYNNYYHEIRLYKEIFLLIFLYSAELWLLTVTLIKSMDAAHQTGVCRKEKVTDAKEYARTGQQCVENIFRE